MHVQPLKNQKPHRAVFEIERVRAAVMEALSSVEDAKQKCLTAGQLLNEVKASLPFGEFKTWRAQNLPEISDDTCERWARAAANIFKALPSPAIDIEVSVSEILTLPDTQLTPAARKYKQAWFEFTADKTIKDCLAGVFVEGDEAHRVDRAVNGKTAKRAGGGGDRKAYDQFIVRALRVITSFVCLFRRVEGVKTQTGWTAIDADMRARVSAALVESVRRWPRWMVEAAVDAGRAELKLTDAERIAR